MEQWQPTAQLRRRQTDRAVNTYLPPAKLTVDELSLPDEESGRG